MALTPERRAALVAARSSAVVGAHFGVDIPASEWSEFGSAGAAAARSGRAWVAPADGEPVGLGAALAWAIRHHAAELDLLVVSDLGRGPLGVVARRAHTFAAPPTVWSLTDGDLTPVVPAEPGPVLAPPPIAAEYILLLEQAGLEVVVEDGQVIGELRGLEVARVVVDQPDPEVAGRPQAVPEARLEVGVGRFDREAFALLHGELSPPEALARVVAEVSQARQPAAEPNPIARLARERWLRYQLINDPALVGATHLEAVEGPEPRGGLRETNIAVALGQRADDESPLVVVTSVGVDLEAVPQAADARLRHSPEAELLIVVPPRDNHRVTQELAARLARPARVLAVEGEWPS